MENSKKPAFSIGFANEQHHLYEEGLTKREYFAGLAMQAILSNPVQHSGVFLNWVAEASLKYADQLLNQLEK